MATKNISYDEIALVMLHALLSNSLVLKTYDAEAVVRGAYAYADEFERTRKERSRVKGKTKKSN